MHWIDGRSLSTLRFYSSLLTTFVSFCIILVSKLYCKLLLWFLDTSSSNTSNPPCNFIPIFIFFLSFFPCFSVIYTYHGLTLATLFGIRFSIERYLFLSVALSPSKLCIYINYVYSSVPWCARLLPVYRVNADLLLRNGIDHWRAQQIPWRERCRDSECLTS